MQMTGIRRPYLAKYKVNIIVNFAGEFLLMDSFDHKYCPNEGAGYINTLAMSCIGCLVPSSTLVSI